MKHLQNKTRKANGLRQFSNLDVNIALARDHTLDDPGTMPCIAFGACRRPRGAEIIGTGGNENRINLLLNSRSIYKEFAPIGFT